MARRKRDTLSASLFSQDTKSASLADAERKIHYLEVENLQLREQLAETKSLYIQLTTENRHEKFNERRVTLLKSQLIQLERQLLLLNDALGARMNVVLEAENGLQVIADRCRDCKDQEARIGGFFISNDDLNKIIETAESARLKLFKNIENTTMHRLHKPVQFMDKFVKHNKWKECTLLDVCSGELSHINLKQVGKLESKLSQTYSQLQKVNHCLTVHLFAEHDGRLGTNSAPQANYVKMLGESCKACNMLNEILPDMLELSVLVPSAPWPALSKPVVKELTVDNVMARMPAMSKAKSQEATSTISALLKVLSLIQLKATTQEKTYREELQFHKSVYDLQLDYIDNLFKALRVAYEQFENDINELICAPLDRVLTVYQSLKKTAAEEALRVFLATFKEYEPQMSVAVAKLKKDESFNGQAEALSGYAKDFFGKLDGLQLQCQEIRDENIAELQEIKEQQKEYWSEIRKLMQDSYIQDQDRDTNSSFTGRNKKKTVKDRGVTPDKGWDSSIDITREDSVLENSEPYLHDTPTHRSDLGDMNSSRNDPNILKTKKYDSKGANLSCISVSKVQNSASNYPNLQEESENLFKSMLRGGLDDGSGFVFDSAIESTICVAAPNKPVLKGQKTKPPLAKPVGKLMKGVGQSKLLLRPISANKTTRSRSPTPEMNTF